MKWFCDADVKELHTKFAFYVSTQNIIQFIELIDVSPKSQCKRKFLVQENIIFMSMMFHIRMKWLAKFRGARIQLPHDTIRITIQTIRYISWYFWCLNLNYFFYARHETCNKKIFPTLHFFLLFTTVFLMEETFKT